MPYGNAVLGQSRVIEGSRSRRHCLTKSALCKANSAASERQVFPRLQLEMKSRCWKMHAMTIAGSDDRVVEWISEVLGVCLALTDFVGEAVVVWLHRDGGGACGTWAFAVQGRSCLFCCADICLRLLLRVTFTQPSSCMLDSQRHLPTDENARS